MGATDRQGNRQDGATDRQQNRQAYGGAYGAGGYYGGGGYGYGGGGYWNNAGAWVAGAAIAGTAIAVGTAITASAYAAQSCTPTTVVAGGTSYYLCGSTWYTRAYSGGDVAYVVVNPPPGY